ncbi:type II secretion system F family protein [Nocardioides sp.]|uniref:type II secretion system F family protein n=1 Tax=Nocardioides sp. TaxID=35761 RepID=UPI003D133694
MVFFLGAALVFVALFMVFAAIGGLQSETRGVNRSLAVLEAMTSAPTEMAKEYDAPFGERVLAPLYERVTKLGRRITGADAADRIRHKLDLAGNPPGWTVDRVSAGKIVGAVCGFGMAGVFSLLLGFGLSVSLVVIAGGTVAGFFGPNMYLYQQAFDRTARMQSELPDAIDLLTISVESGLGFDAALMQVSRNTDGPLAGEFSRVIREMQLGMGRSDALRALGERNSMPDLKSFVSSMVQADAFGIPVGQVLRVQSNEIRIKRRQWAEEQAQKVPVKITVPLIFCILPCLFIAVLGPAVIQIMNSGIV